MLKKTLAMFMALLMLASSAPYTVFAANPHEMTFTGAYDSSNRTLTVTASITKSDTNIGAGMFVLNYDEELLSTDSTKVTYLNGSATSATYYSADDGYIGADWYYNTELTSSDMPVDAVSIEFELKDGVKPYQLTDESIVLCADTDYLNDIGGYGTDGGALLCQSMDYFNVVDGTLDTVLNCSPGITITSIDKCQVTTVEGTAPVLPETVTVRLSDGSTDTLSVDWEDVTADDYAAAGSFTVEGTVSYISINAECEVTVTKAGYTVSFDANGGENAPANQNKPAGEDMTITSSVPTRDSYEFAGWSTDKNVVRPEYKSGDTYSEDAELKLYAVWNAVGNSSAEQQLTLTGVYDRTSGTITVTAAFVNPDAPIGAGMFALAYDTESLVLGEVTYLNDAQESATTKDTVNGYLGCDFYFNSNVSASEDPTEVATIVFTLKDGVKFKNLQKDEIIFCTDNEFLDDIGGYAVDGPALLCYGGVYYSLAENNLALVNKAIPDIVIVELAFPALFFGREGESYQKALAVFTPADSETGETFTTGYVASEAGGTFEVEIEDGQYTITFSKRGHTKFTVTGFDTSLSAIPDDIVLYAGDINGDGFINAKDNALMTQAFGSRLSDPDSAYNENADFNEDGFINAKDRAQISMNFGKRSTEIAAVAKTEQQAS